MRISHARAAIALLLLLVAAAIPAHAQQATPTTKPAFILGADISTLAQVEQRGGIFKDKDKPGDALAIFMRHGWNCFRLRIFVNPNGRGGVINSLDYTRALAQRIKASGATLLLDFHYSDTWADPQHQVVPAAWKNLDADAMQTRVEQYTAEVLTDLKQHAATPDIVQIGNEITGGTLWPDTQVQVPESKIKVFDSTVTKIVPPQPYDDVEHWNRLIGILKAAGRGVRSATVPADNTQIMIHIDCGGDWPVTQWFFDHLEQGKVDYDMIGQSYYPNWHGTLDNVRDNLRRTAVRYGKPIVIVETAYPWKGADFWSKKANMAWPISPDGQKKFLSDLIAAVHEIPGGLGAGVVYWHPEGIGLRRPDGTTTASAATSLFDDQGNALPALDVLNPSP